MHHVVILMISQLLHKIYCIVAQLYSSNWLSLSVLDDLQHSFTTLWELSLSISKNVRYVTKSCGEWDVTNYCVDLMSTSILISKNPKYITRNCWKMTAGWTVWDHEVNFMQWQILVILIQWVWTHKGIVTLILVGGGCRVVLGSSKKKKYSNSNSLIRSCLHMELGVHVKMQNCISGYRYWKGLGTLSYSIIS